MGTRGGADIARTKSIVKDKDNTVYGRFKWFKRYIFGLAQVDTGNLVKSTLESKEFWDLMGGKVTVKCDLLVGTAEKEGKGLNVVGKGEEFKFIFRRDRQGCVSASQAEVD